MNYFGIEYLLNNNDAVVYVEEGIIHASILEVEDYWEKTAEDTPENRQKILQDTYQKLEEVEELLEEIEDSWKSKEYLVAADLDEDGLEVYAKGGIIFYQDNGGNHSQCMDTPQNRKSIIDDCNEVLEEWGRRYIVICKRCDKSGDNQDAYYKYFDTYHEAEQFFDTDEFARTLFFLEPPPSCNREYRCWDDRRNYYSRNEDYLFRLPSEFIEDYCFSFGDGYDEEIERLAEQNGYHWDDRLDVYTCLRDATGE